MKPLKLTLVITAVDNQQNAEILAEKLIKKGLAACVQITRAITSHYFWQGKKETTKEYLLLIKTLTGKFKNLKKFLKKRHPYDLPEIIGIEIDHCNFRYLKWLTAQIDQSKKAAD